MMSANVYLYILVNIKGFVDNNQIIMFPPLFPPPAPAATMSVILIRSLSISRAAAKPVSKALTMF